MSAPRGSTTNGAQDWLTLSFLDRALEERYQRDAGAESLGGFRAIAFASGLIWALVVLILPFATRLDPWFVVPVGLGMSVLGFSFIVVAGRAPTLNRQHALSSLLTTANSTVVLALGLIGNVFPGYAVAAILLLFAWAFVSRTRFVYAAARTLLVAVAFFVAVFLYPGPASLLVDVLFFITGAVGTLLALRILERNRRQVYFQDAVIHEQGQQLEAEMNKSDELIRNMLPPSIATRLREGERIIADDYASVTVLFGDIVGFTPMSARLSAHQLIVLLSGLFARFDDLVTEAGLEKIKTIGDNYMAVGGLSGEPDHAVRVVRLGLSMVEEANRHEALGSPIRLRVGIHSGPVAGGVIGTHKLAFDLWGDTVNVASRLQEIGLPDRVHISQATWLLVRDRFRGEPLGDRELRGHPGMPTYAVVP